MAHENSEQLRHFYSQLVKCQTVKELKQYWQETDFSCLCHYEMGKLKDARDTRQFAIKWKEEYDAAKKRKE